MDNTILIIVVVGPYSHASVRRTSIGAEYDRTVQSTGNAKKAQGELRESVLRPMRRLHIIISEPA